MRAFFTGPATVRRAPRERETMLENLRKQGASAFIWVVFAILIGMFVINFGQQSAGAQQGCHLSSGARVAVKVGGHEVDESGLRLAVNIGALFERGGDDAAKTRRAMERLIARELLAGEAERRGLRVPEGLVRDAIVHGKLHVAGQSLDARGLFFARLDDEDEAEPTRAPDPEDLYFDYKLFKNRLRNMGISVGIYSREQTREILASTMARILLRSAPASREEALSQYISDNTRVSFNAVRFDANKYAEALVISEADLERWVRGHEGELKTAYVADAWKGKKQIHLRRIFVAKSPPPPAPATQPAGAPAPAAPATPPVDPARTKLAALRDQIAAGKRGFAEAAAQTEANPQIAARNGDWGWHDEGVTDLPEPALNNALKTLVQGKVSDVIDGSDGFYLLLVDDRREGDLTLEQVKLDLALSIARTAWGKEAARRAAIAAVTEATRSGKHLGELFPAGKAGLAPGVMVSDRPVSWQAGDGSAPAAPAAPAAPGVPGALDAAGVPTAPTTGAPAEPSIMEPSKEALPQLGALDTPTVERHDGIARAGDNTPLGESAELARALFDQLAVGTVGERIFEVRPSVVDPLPTYVAVQVTGKELADVSKFEKDAPRLVERLATIRGVQLYQAWLRDRCTTLVAAGKIKPNLAYLQAYDDQNRKLPITYQPCESMTER